MNKFRIVVGIAVVLAGALVYTKPSTLQPLHSLPSLPPDLDRYLSESEAEVDRQFGLIDGAAKRIRWYDEATGKQTPLSIVYLHGFSATRQEVAPVGEMIADQLQANLFETRLKAHGLQNNALRDVVAEDWLQDAAEALAVGSRIGERVVLIGTSTGATLALAMLDHPLMSSVDVLILMSPNLVLQDTNSEFLLWPGGPILARLILGEERSWQPRNELQERYWTTTYPTPSVIEMLRLMDYARRKLPITAEQRLLTITAPGDAVVNPGRSREYLNKIAAADNHYIEFTLSADEGQHVLAGDILSPDSNQPLTDIIVNFVEDTL